MRDLDVAVVGGGLAGLAAAAFAGRDGLSVGVFERAAALGGRARTQDKDGFLFNQGPHALYRGGEALRALRDLGIPVSGGVPPLGGAYAIRAGRLHALPVGTYSLMTTGLLPLTQKLEAGRALAGLGRRVAREADSLSEGEWLRAELRSESVRELVAAFFRLSTYAHDPGRQSAGAALAQFQRGLEAGVLYLDGGWQSLVDGLQEAVLRSGVAISSHSGVLKLHARLGAASSCASPTRRRSSRGA